MQRIQFTNCQHVDSHIRNCVDSICTQLADGHPLKTLHRLFNAFAKPRDLPVGPSCSRPSSHGIEMPDGMHLLAEAASRNTLAAAHVGPHVDLFSKCSAHALTLGKKFNLHLCLFLAPAVCVVWWDEQTTHCKTRLEQNRKLSA